MRGRQRSRAKNAPLMSLPALARRCRLAAEAGLPVQELLRAEASWLCDQLTRDAQSPSTLRLWGKSRNEDELAKLSITHPEVLKALWSMAGQPFPKQSLPLRSFHAGLLHTYGYLLSTIRTPYGFKRSRWVRPNLERGLGLPACSLRPRPREGTLLGNLSLILTRLLAQTGELSLSLPSGANIRKDLCDVALPTDKRLCIDERFSLASKGEYSIHTELLPLQLPSTWLLIYAAGRERSEKLITTFMVGEQMVNELSKLPLGKSQVIRLRFNAALSGVNPAALEDLRGHRSRRMIKP